MTAHAEIEWVLLPKIEGRASSIGSHILRWFLGAPEQGAQPGEEYWARTRALYAFFDPHSDQPLYIGKAWGSKVYRRVHAKDKHRVLKIIREEFQLGLSDLDIYVGIVTLNGRGRLTRQLLAELEQLLIYQLQPFANTHSTQSYKCRDGLCVRCGRDWPLRLKTIVDEFGIDAQRERREFGMLIGIARGR